MLSKRQIDILKYLYPDKKCEQEILCNIFDLSKNDQVITTLAKDNLLTLYYDNQKKVDIVFLTEQGRAYIQDHDNQAKSRKIMCFHDWMNTAVAILALIVAIISLFR